jgi:hypothetical protein
MTRTDVEQAVAILKRLRLNEARRAAERGVWWDVLRAIADGAPNARELADAALGTLKHS